MNCPKCKTSNPEGSRFCLKCGASLEAKLDLICPSCGTKLPNLASYCNSCGTELTGVSDPDREIHLRELQQVAPRGLQEKMRAAGSGIEGQRKPVTILFSDIVGSTSIAEYAQIDSQ